MMVVRGIGIATSALLATLGLIHVYWAIRGSGNASMAIPERAGRPLFRPSRIGTLTVAGLLVSAAVILLSRMRLLGSALPPGWSRLGSWLLAVIFGMRAIGDFRYVGVFKRVTGTPFARWDTRLFTPLSALIALGAAAVAATPPSHFQPPAERIPPGTHPSCNA